MRYPGNIKVVSPWWALHSFIMQRCRLSKVSSLEFERQVLFPTHRAALMGFRDRIWYRQNIKVVSLPVRVLYLLSVALLTFLALLIAIGGADTLPKQ